jgi:hypothetical protein
VPSDVGGDKMGKMKDLCSVKRPYYKTDPQNFFMFNNKNGTISCAVFVVVQFSVSAA